MGPAVDPTNGNPKLKELLARDPELFARLSGQPPAPPPAPLPIVDASKPRPIAPLAYGQGDPNKFKAPTGSAG